MMTEYEKALELVIQNEALRVKLDELKKAIRIHLSEDSRAARDNLIALLDKS